MTTDRNKNLKIYKNVYNLYVGNIFLRKHKNKFENCKCVIMSVNISLYYKKSTN